ncbi:MAG: nucleoside monophosphate kinase [Parcubacteria group bacterium]|jgi:adenylate kinase
MNLVILGPQGSGKGTQASKLAQKFDLEHIDMGKFLREVAKLDTPLGKQIHEIINIKKELVSDRILREVIHLKIMGLPRERGVVFDGVPRNIEQLNYFEEVIKESGRKIDKAILIKLSEEESLKRISKRRICEKCKKVFILGKDIQNEDEKCNICEGKIIQRIDDTKEGVMKRLKIFEKETMPMSEYYKKQGKFIEIDGDKEIEKVFESILKEL